MKTRNPYFGIYLMSAMAVAHAAVVLKHFLVTGKVDWRIQP